MFTYYGGKQRLASKILKLLPPHKIYVEPFCGAAALFFIKTPSDIEVLNDKNKYIVNLFRVLRGKGSTELIEKLELIPYAIEDFNRAREVLKCGEGSDVELAWAFFVAVSMSFSGDFTNSSWKRAGRNSPKNNMPKTWRNRVDRLYIVVERLRMCQIECSDAIDIIKKYDSPDTAFYLDPPYLNADQGPYKGYSENEFSKLIECLNSLEGSFLLSNYENPFVPSDWEKHEFETTVSARMTRREKVKEIIWRKVNGNSRRQFELF